MTHPAAPFTHTHTEADSVQGEELLMEKGGSPCARWHKEAKVSGWRETDTEREAKLTEQSVTERQEDKRKKKGTETEKRDREREKKRQ